MLSSNILAIEYLHFHHFLLHYHYCQHHHYHHQYYHHIIIIFVTIITIHYSPSFRAQKEEVKILLKNSMLFDGWEEEKIDYLGDIHFDRMLLDDLDNE